MIQAGDVILTIGSNPISKLIAHITRGRKSHCIAMVSPTHGLETGFFQRAKIEDVTKYFTPKYEMVVVHDPDCNVDQFVQQAYRLEGRKYDWIANLGFMASKNVQRAKRFNCAEAVLSCLHAGQSCLGRGYRFITPHSLEEGTYFGALKMKLHTGPTFRRQ